MAAMIYLFMSAFEHNREGAVTNQILPAELKPPDRLHDQRQQNKHYFQEYQPLNKTTMPHDISLSAGNSISRVKKC